jgi:GMP synthase-like glutamine amidotransferase
VQILAVIHEEDAPPGTFGDVVRERGHELDVRSFAAGDPPPDDAAGRYDAAIVFGGAAQVDQDDQHPWLRDLRGLTRELIDREVPLLGVCLGGQLVAQVSGGPVGPAVVPEVGWHPVELTDDGAADPVLGGAPRRFAAYQGHFYGFGLPPGAVALAHGNGDALQAYRIGDSTWGIQFHPEITLDIVDRWIAEHVRDGDVDDEAALREQTVANLPRWTALGRSLCGRFVDYAASRRSRDLRHR